MQKVITIILLLLLLTGCASQIPTTSANPYETDMQLTIPQANRPIEPDVTITKPSLTIPECPPPTEPVGPVEITAEKAKEYLGGVFTFGNLLAAPVTYYWYPYDGTENSEFVEAIFEYNNIEYIARVKVTPCRTDITGEDLPWEEPYDETNVLPDLPGLIRRCRVGKQLYTNLLWYNKEQKCTYSLFWVGGREDYLKLAPTLFGYPGVEYVPN
ncbi:MAG: hypothetical protein IJZ68_06225 [Bacteroidaceae bacterium]|nr:hypothetical protein [Bacteroidaceae bacterium]